MELTYAQRDTNRRGRLAPARRAVSRIRHAEAPVRLFALDIGPSELVPPQPRGWSQVVTLRRGIALIACGSRRTLLTPQVGYYVPAGETFSLETQTRCELRIVFVRAERLCFLEGGPKRVGPLLNELLERMTVRGYLDPSIPRDARLSAVIEDELAALEPESSTCSLVRPTHPRLVAAIDTTFIGDRDERLTIGQLAGAAAMSVRTFERHFVRETGLTPREWLRRARLVAAAIALASGASVTDAALGCGYSSLSAFIAAYRIVFGTTPGATVRRR